jgi:hypothetical protein
MIVLKDVQNRQGCMEILENWVVANWYENIATCVANWYENIIKCVANWYENIIRLRKCLHLHLYMDYQMMSTLLLINKKGWG